MKRIIQGCFAAFIVAYTLSSGQAAVLAQIDFSIDNLSGSAYIEHVTGQMKDMDQFIVRSFLGDPDDPYEEGKVYGDLNDLSGYREGQAGVDEFYFSMGGKGIRLVDAVQIYESARDAMLEFYPQYDAELNRLQKELEGRWVEFRTAHEDHPIHEKFLPFVKESDLEETAETQSNIVRAKLSKDFVDSTELFQTWAFLLEEIGSTEGFIEINSKEETVAYRQDFLFYESLIGTHLEFLIENRIESSTTVISETEFGMPDYETFEIIPSEEFNQLFEGFDLPQLVF